MEQPDKKLTTVGPQEGACVAWAGGNYRIVISGAETGGAYGVIEMVVPPGSGPGPHAHPDIQESFHVLEGEVEVQTEEKSYIAVTGAFVNMPLGGMVHRFKNVSDQMARLWCVVVPAGLEAFFAEIGRPTEQGVFTPPPVMTPEDMVRIRAIAERYGQVLYPPDYFDKLHKSDEQKKSGPAHDIPATHDAKVNGIGGIFFKCNDPKAVMAWYKEHLGFNTTAYGAGFDWQEVSGRKKSTQWSPFPATTKYMDPSVKDFMINYRVDNLEKLVEQLKKANVTILDTIETYEYGKFIHIMDIEGNKIELYEPNYEHAAKK